MGGKESLERPIGKMFSPSKLPKCVPLNMEIEPVPVIQESSRNKSERLEKSLTVLKAFAN